MRHLTDDEIMDYLDLNPQEKAADIKIHLSECPQCRENLAVYENIYTELSEEPEIGLSHGFAAKVVGNLDNRSLKSPKFNFFNILIITACVFLVLILTAQYVDLGAIGKTTVNSMIPSLDLQPGQMMEIETESVDIFAKFKFLIFGIGILGLFYVLDKVVLNKKIVKSNVVICF